MARAKIVRSPGALFIGLLLIPAAALAQNTGIAGVVKDTSGAVIPGVTVEAASPALIEKVRSVVTDSQGLYSIVDLRPGIYTVTFTLTGFQTVRREGIELTGSFTAAVNAELTVGAVAETLTVSGSSPSVDVRNVVQAQVLTSEVRESLPTDRSALGMSELLPGVTVSSTSRAVGHDVIGIADNRGGSMIHGSRAADYQLMLDGTPQDMGGSGQGQSWQSIPSEVQEFVYELTALSAENIYGGVRVNIIPKEGGNRFSFYTYGAYADPKLEGNNITPQLEAQGVFNPDKIQQWDLNLAIGGPLKADHLWFFTAAREHGQNEQIAGMYKAIDLNSYVFNPALGTAGNVNLNKPAVNQARYNEEGLRLTWQASQNNKLSLYTSTQPRNSVAYNVSGTLAYEASLRQNWQPHRMTQGNWKSVITPKLLLEAGGMYNMQQGPSDTSVPALEYSNIVSVTDAGTGFTYRAPAVYGGRSYINHPSAKITLSYVTGAHAAKVGYIAEWAENYTLANASDPLASLPSVSNNMTFTFRNGVPIQITEYNYPRTTGTSFFEHGAFAQDQWTLKRLTVNAGLRLELYHGSVRNGDTSGPNQYVGFQQWTGLSNVPNWKDLTPRLGVAYDVFGTGKTAIKGTFSKYVVNDANAFQALVNPIGFNLTTTRNWTDSNPNDFAGGQYVGNGVPSCNLANPSANGDCGSISNTAFATAATTTHIDPAYQSGWGVRAYDWERGVSIQQQVTPQLSVNFAYTKRTFGNFIVTDNLAVRPSDYDQYCVTAPTDPRLGSVSGSQVCGLYDLSPAARARTPNNLVTPSAKFGTQTESWQGIDLLFNARLPHSTVLSGGLNNGTAGTLLSGTGGTMNSSSACFVYNSPQLRFCDVRAPWRSDVRIVASTALWWGLTGAITMLSEPGSVITAAYTVTNANIGKTVQFVDPARTTFSGGSATVALVAPDTLFNDRLNQIDIRLAKTFGMGSVRGSNVKGRLTLDIGNLLNASTAQLQNNTYGGSWLKPVAILQPRVFKPGLLIEF
jgi:hypothetical protein